jgi:AAA domain
LFSSLSDTDLLSLGIPEDLLARVRQITSEAELDVLQQALPIEAYEGLFLVAAGDTVSQVLSARETQVDRPIDTEDFASSVETAESQSRFVVVDNDEALTAIMNAPLAQWRVFLHPIQKKLAIGDRSGPVRVLGGAGTGKTVLAMHRAKWLAEHATPPDKKVLVTTFTRNLAIDIETNLNTLCARDVMSRIEVRNLDAWVLRFLRSKRYEQTIVYGRQNEAAECWSRALAVKDASLGLDDEFYAAELEQVILAQGVATLDAYRAARRVGRGVMLNRAKRDAVWPVFEEYRAQLASRRLKEVDDAYRDAAQLIAKDSHYPYSAIVVDETQDFGPQALRLLRALIEPGKNDLFFVGDGHQRIYDRNKAGMSRSGIDIRGRARKLYINYRTTDEIRRQAVALLEGVEVDDLDDGADDNSRYKSLSHGPAPIKESCLSWEDLVTRVQAILADWGGGAGCGGPGCDVHHGGVEVGARSADVCHTLSRVCGGVHRSGHTRQSRGQWPAVCDNASGEGVGVSERHRDEHKGREGGPRRGSPATYLRGLDPGKAARGDFDRHLEVYTTWPPSSCNGYVHA